MISETGDQPRPLGRSLAGLHAALDASLLALTSAPDPAELAAAVSDVIVLRNRFDALVGHYFSEVETSGLLAVARARSVTEFVAGQTSADPLSVRNATYRGRWLRTHPTVDAAFSAGAISGAHIDVIRRSAVPPDMSRAEEVRLVDAARHASFAEFVLALQALRG